jgi:tRNA-(ms[2]io[6]A)-hydroxylase
MSSDPLQDIHDFLGCPTPGEWIQAALENQETLLVDHANCEKKAASTALNLMYRYVDNHTLLNKLSRLAREELRHFEQVIALMKRRKVTYLHVTASRYAGGLRDQVRKQEPGRLIDTLLVGAIIEARSCERFAALVPELDEELSGFYASLLKSEARHFKDYLALARQVGEEGEISSRLEIIRQTESELILSDDEEFRFHSGRPTF